MVSSAEIPAEFLYSWDPHRKSTARTTVQTPNSEVASRSDIPVCKTSKATPLSTGRAKICSSCDSCRQARVKCSRGVICQRCRNNELHCKYSFSQRSGRLKANREKQSTTRNGPITPQVAQGSETDLSSEKDDGEMASTEHSPDSDMSGPTFEDLDGYGGLTLGAEYDSFANDIASFTSMNPIMEDFTCNGLNFQSFDTVPTSHSTSSSYTTTSTIPSSSSSCTGNSELEVNLPAFSGGLVNSLDSLGTRSTCPCFATQLQCVGKLYGLQQEDAGLDAILQLAREVGKQIAEYLSCTDCFKTSIIHFVFPTIMCQQLVKLFCYIAEAGPISLKSRKINLGSFEFSEEDDLMHKKLLVTSAAKHIVVMLSELGNTVSQYQVKQFEKQTVVGDVSTDSGRSNLKWIFESIRNLKLQLATIIGMLDSGNWGLAYHDPPDHQ